MSVERQPAFVLHTRAYRETSQLVDILTPDFGRVRTVARGARKQRGLQPFTELEVCWRGKSDLKSLVSWETRQTTCLLTGAALYSGLYLNELLVRLVHESDEHSALYRTYQRTLALIASGDNPEVALRQFELSLLRELGYGLELSVDAFAGEQITTADWYWFEPTVGLERRNRASGDDRIQWFSGSSIQAINASDFSQAQVRRDAKRLLRLALKPLLGDKPLQSRLLFSAKVAAPVSK